jgi:urate oxidase
LLSLIHRYTEADNSVVVATDSIKNTTFITAKQNPVTPPELFGSILGTHFIEKYKHIHVAHVNVITHRWTRMNIDGKLHPHSFLRDGTETRNVQVDVTEGKGIKIKSSIVGLHVLKSTGSKFWGYVRDEFTTLKETWDRILCTEVDAIWTWQTFEDVSAVKANASRFDSAWTTARSITLRTFAHEDSASVQNLMYKMAEQILAAMRLIETVEYSLPNKHYFEVDLSWHKGLKNTGKDAEVYAPQSGPNGLINCVVARSDLRGLDSKL